MRSILAILVLACASVAVTPGAAASPLEDPSLAGATTFTGPMRPHGTSLFINPAAMAMASRGQHVLVLGSARLAHLWVDRQIVDADGTAVDGPDAAASTLSPGGLLAFDFAIADRYRLGLSVHTPLARRFVEGEEPLRYHSLGGHIYQFTGTFSGSVAAHERVLLGFGISLGYSTIGFDFARDTALEGGSAGIMDDCDGSPCGVENPLADERYRIRARTRGFRGLFAAQNLGLVGGIMVRVTETWWLGLSILAPPGSVSGPLELAGETRVRTAPRLGERTVRGDSEVIYDNAQSIYLGARGPITPALELVAHLRWQNLSVHQRWDVRLYGGDLEAAAVPTQLPRYLGFSDVVTAVVGVETPDTERLRFGGRVSAETGAVGGRQISAQQPHPFSIGGNGGIEVRLGDHLVVTGVYGLTWSPRVSARDSAFDPLDRIACIDQDFDLDACAGARQGRALPSANGDYDRLEHVLQLSIRYDTL